MPLFEYQCKACQEIEEVLAKHSDPPPTKCEACGKKGKMEKVVSITSFQLKGGGWYKDLYGSVPKDDKSKSSDSTDSSSSSSSTKGDEKAMTKSEKKAKDSKPAKSKSTTKKPAA